MHGILLSNLGNVHALYLIVQSRQCSLLSLIVKSKLCLWYASYCKISAMFMHCPFLFNISYLHVVSLIVQHELCLRTVSNCPITIQGDRVAQSVTCLASYVCLTADPGVGVRSRLVPYLSGD